MASRLINQCCVLQHKLFLTFLFDVYLLELRHLAQDIGKLLYPRFQNN